MRIEKYALEKYIILKIVKIHGDYTVWTLMKGLYKLRYSMARKSLELLIRNMVNEGEVELVLRTVYKRRKSFSIQITKKGLSKLSELENRIRVSLTSCV